jgi:diaminopimelate epimerase
MNAIQFYKYVSIGNDFVLIDQPMEEYADFARAICARRFGAGSDGLLVLTEQDGEHELRMFNPDGSEDFCGNGIRCAALHLWRGSAGEIIKIRHGGRSNAAVFSAGGWIDVGLPPARFDAGSVPVVCGLSEMFRQTIQVAGSELLASAVTTGSTHTVIERGGEPDDEEFARVSPILENDARFPMRTSVIWAWPTGEKSVRIRIWERGVGETLGCGTGSAAAAAVWFRNNPKLLAVAVENPGGEAVVSRGENNGLVVSAKAKRVYEGRFAIRSNSVGSASACV